MILYDGTTNNFKKGWYKMYYILLAGFGFTLNFVAIPAGIHFSVLYAPFSIPLFVVLILTAQELHTAIERSRFMVRISTIGILSWGASLFIIPFTIIEPIYFECNKSASVCGACGSNGNWQYCCSNICDG